MKNRYRALIGATILISGSLPVLAQEAKTPETGATVEAPVASSPAPNSETKPAAQSETQTPPEYLDNRSTPETLIKSYYNAINRQEYARAYSYYVPDSPPQPFPQFQAGYENTASVTVQFGKVEGEGAAGSAYWSQPVAIKSEAKDGAITVYYGCYRLKLANPAIQGVPFLPLSLIDGTLQKSEKSMEDSVPEGCEAP
ncbi:hypothetical protein [Phyllobacterium sp. YR531]|uniref:hypothetical protein n=1 Tax=Phyllobacterium sp. YR531 TaxID=1144343 RepID=UPI00026F5ACC|nr:hypothetical protein [Phyllobacterium sp. YR531]EJN06561.1 hypothetical protein PMI41_00241 [Phyllobacterium sp. YR531]